MNELERIAILGTVQVGLGDASSELTHTPVDGLIAQLRAGPETPEPERLLLLHAGAHAALRRAAALPVKRAAPADVAPSDTLRPSGLRLNGMLAALLDWNEHELLAEALQRMARAGMRLAPMLLPSALEQRLPARRALLRPLLGARGLWLAKQRAAWAWALAAEAADALPADLEQRWSEQSAADRRALLLQLRERDPARARELIAAHIAGENAEQRLAWLEVMAHHLGPEDEPLLAGLRSDRSAGVRVAAARLQWRLPDSALARRVQARAAALVQYEPGRRGLLRTLTGAQAVGRFQVQLPPERYDPDWANDGVVEVIPRQGIGQRQWLLLQLVSVMPPDRWPDAPEQVLAAAQTHEHAGVLLDGLTSAAVRFESRAWFAPLWDCWRQWGTASWLTDNALAQLTRRLEPDAITARAGVMLQDEKARAMLIHVPSPWPLALGREFVAHMPRLPAHGSLFGVAARAIALESLPAELPGPSTSDDVQARSYARALDQFQSIVSLRRDIAQETV